MVTEFEECDDGDLDPNDGCTPDCEWSCENDDDCSGKDECLGYTSCVNHICTGSSKLDNETECKIVEEKTKNLCGDSDYEKTAGVSTGSAPVLTAETAIRRATRSATTAS